MSLKNRILILCGLNKMTVRQLARDTGFSEQSFYRWFKEDTMEIKHLKIIADYFKQPLTYFFSDEDPNDKPVLAIAEPASVYKNDLKDRYITVLEENTRLMKELTEVKDKLAWYELNCDCGKTKQPDGKKSA